jgi:hypothetical protein
MGDQGSCLQYQTTAFISAVLACVTRPSYQAEQHPSAAYRGARHEHTTYQDAHYLVPVSPVLQVGSFMTISVSVTFPALCHQILYKGQNSTGKVRVLE